MSFRRSSLLTWCLLTSITAIGCSAAVDETESTAQPIIGGVNDTTHTAVVGIRFFVPEGVGTCTGTLLMPNLVLTARHCVSPIADEYVTCQSYTDTDGTVHEVTVPSAPYARDRFGVTASARVSTDPRATGFVGVAEVIIPSGTTGTALCGHDVALLRLSSPLTGVGLVEPRLDQAPIPRELFTAVGYGATSGSGTGVGTRRMRAGLDVEQLGPGYSSRRIQVLTGTEWLGNTGTCQGDSGGPALDGAGAVMGVLSRGPADCSYPVYTRVDSYASWIRSAARAAATAAGTSAPAWATPPAANSLAFGSSCRSDIECADPYACLVVGGQRRCTVQDCSSSASCPSGWACGTSEGLRACMPAGSDSTGGGGVDTGTGTDAARGFGCAASPGRPSGATGWAAALGLLLGAARLRRRRRARAQ